MTTQSKIHSSFDAKSVRPLVLDKDYALDEYEDLSLVGLHGLPKIVNEAFGMDSIQQGVTTPSIGSLAQFNQAWLPGFVRIMTASRDLDGIIGLATVGNYSDEEVVQGIMENTGSPVPYSDTTNVPFSGYNVNFAKRTIVRFELGMRVGMLEESRSAAMKVNAAAEKRNAAAKSLEITRNRVGFYGYNSGNNNTYGFLNDPNLPAYETVATGGTSSSKLWSLKTFDEICNDIRTALQTLRTQSKNTIDPRKASITLATSSSVVDYMSKLNTQGNLSVTAWLASAYPNVRVTSAPELDGANGGSNVFYLFADNVDDDSSDDGKTFLQIVPAKFIVVGVQKNVKGYEEDYMNASAGVMCKRPYAVFRATGI